MTISHWDLNVPQRRAISQMCMSGGEPLSNLPFVGQKSIDELLRLGLIETVPGPHPPHDEPRYDLTEAGHLVHGEMWKANRIPR
jgi:hypothetical protein